MTKPTKTQKQHEKEILTQIRDLIRRAPIDWAKYHAAQAAGATYTDNPETKRTQQVMAEAEALDRSLAPGLKIGRLVSWPVADGQALYFVAQLGRRMVNLEHLPWGDCYRSPVVVNGQALRPAVERAVKGMDGLRSIFGKSPGGRP